MEEWKDVVGAEKYYQISNLGRIRNKITKCILKPSRSGSYRHIELRYGVNKNVLIHRLVAEAFVPNPNNYSYVNHIDENKENNRADAIKVWESMKEACEKLGLYYQGISACCRGEKRSCGGYVWTYANIANVRMRWKNK